MLSEKVEKSVAKSDDSVIIKARGVEELEQAKKRDHKVLITDVAINKISKVNVSEYSNSQNAMIYEIHKELLTKSKELNNSNEVACLFNIYSEEKAFHFGTEHSVNIFQNPTAYAMSDFSKDKSLFLAHNHPSTQIFSYADLGVFLSNESIGAMSVVSNTGDVHIILKTDSYSYTKAFEKLLLIKKRIGNYNSDVDLQIVKDFLKNSEKIGIVKY